MLSLILASSLFMAPADAGVAESRPATVEFIARLTHERFVAVNSTDRPQLIVLSDRDGVRSARTVIAAGGEVEFDFPGGTLDQLLMRVVSFAGTTVSSTADYDLASIASQRFEFFWMEKRGTLVNAWAMGPAGATFLPGETTTTVGLATQPMAPHVPVITPTDKPKGDLPPRIEEKPLPPV